MIKNAKKKITKSFILAFVFTFIFFSLGQHVFQKTNYNKIFKGNMVLAADVDDFVIKVKTDNPGDSIDTQFVIPSAYGATYNYNVDCNDDGTDEATGQTASYTCDYGAGGLNLGVGTYVVRIKDNVGDGTGFPAVRFAGTTDKTKVISLDQWGTGKWTTMYRAFQECSNMVGNATDTPDLSMTTDLSFMFYGATSFNQDIGSWNVETITNATNMLLNGSLSVVNYDLLLSGWDAQNLQSGVTFHAGNSNWCGGDTARTNMIDNDGWTITDGSLDCSDAVAPVIAEVTPVTTPTTDTTPDYTFSSDEAGTITYGGDCSSSTTAAVNGNNTVTFNVLADGVYANCTVVVTDAAGNASTILNVGSFEVDGTAPIRSNGAPTGNIASGTTNTNITLDTNENATCKYDTSLNTDYDSMANTFTTTGGTSHSTNVTGLSDNNTYTYYVRCEDVNNNKNNDDYTISFVVGTVPNNPPTDITLDSSDIDENQTVNTVVGNLSTTDADVADTHTYTLTCTTPGTDDASFNISGNNLRTNEIFNFETKSSYAICLKTDDGNGGTFDKNFTVTVNDLDEVAPVIAEVTPVTTPTTDTTPDYTFSSDEAGTITYGGDCSSSTTAAVNGNNTVTFNALANGVHSNCTVVVTDAAGNASTTLNVSSFETTYNPSTEDFVIKVKTDNPGDSIDTQFVIPSAYGVTYNYNVDCNDDGTDEATGVTGSYTCDYGAGGLNSGIGTYIVRIKDNVGDGTGFPATRFAGTTDKTKVISLDQWGTGKWTTMYRAFQDCSNMVLNATDTPDLSMTTDLSFMFYGATSVDKNIGNWNVETITNATNILLSTSLSVVNYDLLLNGWNSQNLQSGVSFGAGNSNWCNGDTARTNMIDNDGWTITDGSLDCSDAVAPVIAEVTPVATPTVDTTPEYIFSSSEAGTITYGGDCTSTNTSAVSGNNTVTFNTLANGVHSNCTVVVTDAAGNASDTLSVSSFEVNSDAPVRSNGQPAGSLSQGTTSVTISLDTNKNATCKYNISTTRAAYDDLVYTFTTTGGTSHSSMLSGLTDGQAYNVYVRCKDTSNHVNIDDFPISFSVDSSGSQKFLFIGNSYTGHSAGVHNHFQSMMTESGRSVEVAGEIHGGETFSYINDNYIGHVNIPEVATRIDSNNWEAVILQGYGLAETDTQFNTNGKTLIDMVRGNGHNSEAALFMIWGREDYPAQDAIHRQRYEQLGSDKNVKVAPVGIAVRTAKNQGIDVYADGSHVSLKGSYLAGAVYYSFFTGQSAVGLHSSGYSGGSFGTLTGAETAELQAIAWDVVSAYGVFWNDNISPIRSNGAPTGNIASGTTNTNITLDTNENATCKYDTSSNTDYDSMANTFTTTGGTSHSTNVTGLSDNNTYTYYVRCEDASGNHSDDDFAISFGVGTIANNPPTDITLDSSDIDENQAVNTVVGNLSTTDADVADTHTYTLTCTTPGTDDASFNISGNNLRTNEIFNFETKSSYAICLKTDDGNGGTFDKNFTVTVNDLDEVAPVIAEVTPVTTPTTDTTPDYTFSSDEAGTITYGGDCSSSTTAAVNESNTVTFNVLAVGTHNNCTISVTDIASNVSNTLNIPSFEITSDVTAPILAEVTPVPTPGNDTTPSYTFSSDEAGTITYGGDCSSTTTAAASGNNTVTFNTLANSVHSNCTIVVTDVAGNASATLNVSNFEVDAIAPTIAEVTPVSTPSNDTTPSYTFSSDEAGTITYGGDCSSANTSAVLGNNIIAFNALSAGIHSNCTIIVSDSIGNVSATLNINSFEIDIIAPTIAEVTPVSTPSNDTTPSYTFSSDEAGTITYGGDCSSANTSATTGNNMITFNTLAVGVHNNCTISITDTAGNNSNTLSVPAFEIISDVIAPTITEVTPVPTPGNDTTPSYTFSSDEAGTITYGGDCISVNTSAVSGNNTITFDILAEGVHSNCTIVVTDVAANSSTTLSIANFTVDSIAPVRSAGTPSGILAMGTTAVDITLNTNENATCKYDISPGITYGAMANTFTTTDSTTHSVSISGLENNTANTYYVRCQDNTGNQNSTDYTVSFSIGTTTCTSFTYSSWGSCQSNNTKTRTVSSSSPSGCINGTPELSTSCTYSSSSVIDSIVASIKTPYLEFSGKKNIIKKKKRIYSRKKRFYFRGQVPLLAGGMVKIYRGKHKIGEAVIGPDGKWKIKIKEKKSKARIYKIKYFDKYGNEVKSKKYKIRIDLEKPEFTNLPNKLVKKRGDVIYWKAKDNRKIKRFKVYFAGRIYKIKAPSHRNGEEVRGQIKIPNRITRGEHSMKVKVFDKAGNKTSKTITVVVR